MTADEIMEQNDPIPVSDAILEISNHGHDAFQISNSLWVNSEDEEDYAEIICRVDDDGMVSPKTILEWLGY